MDDLKPPKWRSAEIEKDIENFKLVNDVGNGVVVVILPLRRPLLPFVNNGVGVDQGRHPFRSFSLCLSKLMSLMLATIHKTSRNSSMRTPNGNCWRKFMNRLEGPARRKMQTPTSQQNLILISRMFPNRYIKTSLMSHPRHRNARNQT